MRFGEQSHLAYCTNIHRGENWAETFAGLERYTLEVRRKVCPPEVPYAIGLRLSAQAALELSDPETLAGFKEWLSTNNCYVFTINGFPYGQFHNTRVKEAVYQPDWQTAERLDYTKRLFDILVQLLPEGVAGSVSTVPCSLKAFIENEAQVEAMRVNLHACVDYIAKLSESTGCDLHLGLEPEPMGYLETTPEVLTFFESMHGSSSNPQWLRKHLGVNYDTCHMAIQYEEPKASLLALRDAGIRISKVHLSSALRVKPSREMLDRLEAFVDVVYLHQVVARDRSGELSRWTDLDEALAAQREAGYEDVDEWRIHFHVPLQTEPMDGLGTTQDHLLGVLDVIAEDAALCHHYEFETYTWEVLPEAMKAPDVVTQLTAEYAWCRDALELRGLSFGK